MAEPLARQVARQLAVAIPVAVATALVTAWIGPFFEHRLWVGAFALPLLILAPVLWRVLDLGRSVLLGGRFLVFLLVYCVLFAVLAGSDVLTWKRTLVGYETAVPRNWLGRFLPSHLADWHYLFAPEAPPASDLLVITLPSFEGRKVGDVRYQLAGLIHQAVAHEAKGIAFDFYLQDSAPQFDPLFCGQVEAAASAGVPVLIGYPHAVRQGLVVPRPLAPTVAACLPASRRGSAAGFVDIDERLRMVPLFLRHDPELPSLSLQIARVLDAEEPAHPAGDLVRFLPPRGGIARLDRLPRGDDFELFRRTFVMVGSAAEQDRYATPFGELQGVEIHAWAAHALRSGVFVRPLPAVWSFPTIFALCYLLTAVLARRGGWWRLAGLTGVLSLAVPVAAALAMRFARLWVEVSYPLVAMWGLVGVLGVANGALRRRAREPEVPPEPAPAASEPVFDVFLSHNGKDTPTVSRLAAALRARGLNPWLDVDELVPGRVWQDEVESAMTRCRSAAVIAGADGLGPWEQMEMRVLLSQLVDRRKPVIPVLLPGAPGRPALPLFLTQLTWVDLRKGIEGPALDRLVWGITGNKPDRRDAA